MAKPKIILKSLALNRGDVQIDVEEFISMDIELCGQKFTILLTDVQGALPIYTDAILLVLPQASNHVRLKAVWEV